MGGMTVNAGGTVRTSEQAAWVQRVGRLTGERGSMLPDGKPTSHEPERTPDRSLP